MEGLAEVVWMVDRNQANILTSVITKGEVLQSSLSVSARTSFINIFNRPNIVAVDLTNQIAELSGFIRDYYVSRSQKMSLGDAQHLATAIAYKVDEFHTFDEDDLIPKSGNIAGHKLIICKPKGVQGILFL